MNKATVLACLGWVLSPLSVWGEPVLYPVTGTGKVVFTETGTTTLTVTPARLLVSGGLNKGSIALASASSIGGAVLWRWSGAGRAVSQSVNQPHSVMGRVSADNRLTVSTFSTAVGSEGYPGWYASRDRSKMQNIVLMALPDKQQVAADTYVIYLDAAVWGE